MKYVALLRGINVGGNSLIKMSELKKAFEEAGHSNVLTYINSGNVIFETNKTDTKELADSLEKELSKTFHLDLRIVLRSFEQIKNVLMNVPSEWKKKSDLRCYVAFVREPVSEKDVVKEIELKEGVDSMKTGKGVIYMSTKLSGLTKSGYTKFASKKTYKDVTIRNYNTSQKLLALMEKQ